MTSATDVLRRLLDERGVEYEAPHAGFTIVRTDNALCKFYETLEEPERGVFAVVTTDWLAPAQAIAATLGTGTCHDKGNIERFICSECGCRLDLQDDDWEATMWLDGAAMVPNFCPNCGRKVVNA